jgi:SAM-dependent methyltransferase
MSISQDWTDGYVSGIEYTQGYYHELNPLRSKLAFINAGLQPSESSEFHCELGYGLGISTNIHAAATQSTWYGTDFIPSQARLAQELSAFTNARSKLYDQSFEEFCNRKDLPDFDSINLHGIWTWVSDKNRACIVDFINRKLKVGGVVYLSYNTLPGWASFSPIRHLMRMYEEYFCNKSMDANAKVIGAMNFIEKYLALNPIFAIKNPDVIDRFKAVKRQDAKYIAHEYFNSNWKPMYFNEVSNLLSSAKVDFACSAYYFDHIREINFTNEQLKFMDGTQNQTFKELSKDYMTNQQFRRDYWVKGIRTISKSEQEMLQKKTGVVFIKPTSEISMKVRGTFEADLNPRTYEPLIDYLSDYKIRTIEEIAAKICTHDLSFERVKNAILILHGQGVMTTTQNDNLAIKSKSTTDRFNKEVIERSKIDGSLNYLASPVTGGGIGVGRFDQMFLLAKSNGVNNANEWAKSAWDNISSKGEVIVKNGVELNSDKENIEELVSQANLFAKTRLPVLEALHVI